MAIRLDPWQNIKSVTFPSHATAVIVLEVEGPGGVGYNPGTDGTDGTGTAAVKTGTREHYPPGLRAVGNFYYGPATSPSAFDNLDTYYVVRYIPEIGMMGYRSIKEEVDIIKGLYPGWVSEAHHIDTAKDWYTGGDGTKRPAYFLAYYVYVVGDPQTIDIYRQSHSFTIKKKADVPATVTFAVGEAQVGEEIPSNNVTARAYSGTPKLTAEDGGTIKVELTDDTGKEVAKLLWTSSASVPMSMTSAPPTRAITYKVDFASGLQVSS